MNYLEFDDPTLPQQVQEVINKYAKIDTLDYQLIAKLSNELYDLGYTFEYGLDAVPFNLMKIEEFVLNTDTERNTKGTIVQLLMYEYEEDEEDESLMTVEIYDPIKKIKETTNIKNLTPCTNSLT
jgi:hypothetical protein